MPTPILPVGKIPNVVLETNALSPPLRRFSEAHYFLTVHSRTTLYFLIFSYSVERSIEISLSLAAGGVPVEDLSQGYPEADWDTVLGDMFWEQKSAIGITQRHFEQPLHTRALLDQAASPISLPRHQGRRPFAVQPELRRHVEASRQAQRRISGYAALAQHHFINPPWRNPEVKSQPVLAEVHRFEKSFITRLSPRRIGTRCWEICFWSREG